MGAPQLVPEDVNGALAAIQRQLPDLDEAPLPPTVFHYTDTAGLLGILESGQLWATDYRFLNDSSEIAYSYRLAAEVAAEFAGRRSELAASFVDHIATVGRPSVYVDTPYYLCCFSAADNSLSQWRAYGGRQGFSLAFPGDVSTHPGNHPRGRQNPGVTLLKVIYDPEVHRGYIRALVSGLLDVLEADVVTKSASPDIALDFVIPFYWGQLDRASYRFKHPDFAVEEEWRLVAWGDIHDESFRAAHTITPFTKFDLFSQIKGQRRVGRLPLEAVRHGPSTMASATMAGLDRLLTTHHYAGDECMRLGSNTPVRL